MELITILRALINNNFKLTLIYLMFLVKAINLVVV